MSNRSSLLVELVMYINKRWTHPSLIHLSYPSLHSFSLSLSLIHLSFHPSIALPSFIEPFRKRRIQQYILRVYFTQSSSPQKTYPAYGSFDTYYQVMYPPIHLLSGPFSYCSSRTISISCCVIPIGHRRYMIIGVSHRVEIPQTKSRYYPDRDML
jgi:hypothetical protein